MWCPSFLNRLISVAGDGANLYVRFLKPAARLVTTSHVPLA